jgi:transposase
MMLGRVDPQGSLLEPGLLFGDLVTRGSFHDKLAACGHELISDDDFVGLYALNRGRPSIPPSLMMRSLLLAVKDDTSDRESARRSRVDLDWKHALGVASDFPGIGATTFSLFRSRVVLHHADQALFRKTVRKAVEAGLFPRKILALIDSSPVLGAGAVQDTYELVRSAICKVVDAAGEAALSKKLLRSLRRYLSGAKPKIDWQNPGARQLELARMVAAANKLLEAVKDREDPREAAQLLAALVAQDVEIDPDTGQPRIRQGVAKDRIVSTSDPEMRHGRKSASRRFDGHKLHVVEEESTEIILGVDVGPGNGADGEQAAPMVEEIARDTGVEIAELVGDMAYGDGDTRAAVEEAGARMVAKVPPVVNAGFFPKTNFVIDPEAPSATCPAGHTSTDAHAVRDHKGRSTQRLYFSIEVCGGCPLRAQCVKGEGARSITLSVHEARMATARADELKRSVQAKLHRRPVIERKIDHLQDLGMRKARYRGRRKTLLQALLAATVANFGRLHLLGAFGAPGMAVAA